MGTERIYPITTLTKVNESDPIIQSYNTSPDKEIWISPCSQLYSFSVFPPKFLLTLTDRTKNLSPRTIEANLDQGDQQCAKLHK